MVSAVHWYSLCREQQSSHRKPIRYSPSGNAVLENCKQTPVSAILCR